LQALRQSCDLFDGRRRRRRTCDSRAKAAKCALAKHRPKKRELELLRGQRWGPLGNRQIWPPFFGRGLTVPNLAPSWAVITTRDRPPPLRRSSIRLSEFIPAVLKETKERECSVVSYRPFFFKKKLLTQIPPFITSGSFGSTTNGTGGSSSLPKFRGKPEWPVLLILEHFQHCWNW
jgi:hypothetical protein